MTPTRQTRVIEVHPELSFLALNNGGAIPHRKQSKQGEHRRERLLQGVFADFSVTTVLEHSNMKTRPKGLRLEPNDINDAFVAAWTACRHLASLSSVIPSQGQVDSRGLRMEIHY
jgi:predicted RNase H-like nuclease